MSRPSWVTDPDWPRAPKESADLCDAAADVIAVNGWQQFGLWPGGGEWEAGQPVCLAGGLRVALDAYKARASLTDPPAAVVDRDARAVIQRLADTFFLPYWNDVLGRDVGEVLELLRRAGKELREMEGGGS